MSRRTDIPAFYGEWFERRLEAGFAGWVNPFGGQRHLVSLRREDVAAFVFWSKNYRPFLPVLARLRERGDVAVFHYTITGLPALLERHAVATDDAIDSLLELSGRYGADRVYWRYDPIILSPLTPAAHHLAQFAALCARLRGRVERCYVSFACRYGKVERSFQRLEQEHGLHVSDPAPAERLALARQLAAIAAAHGIDLHSCCGDDLVGDGIQKGRCIDGAQLARLCGLARPLGPPRPTRPGCGCAAAADIGAYDTCPHGCVYCYANVNPERAAARFAAHDPASAFLGYPRAQSDRFLEAIPSAAHPEGSPHRLA